MAAEVFTLNVNPQDLINTAEMFRDSGSVVTGVTDEMMSLVSGLSSVWNGSAAEAYMSRFAALDDDILRMIGMINEHVNDLETMAQNYTGAEEFGVENADILSTDVII